MERNHKLVKFRGIIGMKHDYNRNDFTLLIANFNVGISCY